LIVFGVREISSSLALSLTQKERCVSNRQFDHEAVLKVVLDRPHTGHLTVELEIEYVDRDDRYDIKKKSKTLDECEYIAAEALVEAMLWNDIEGVLRYSFDLIHNGSFKDLADMRGKWSFDVSDVAAMSAERIRATNDLMEAFQAK
jgi:hypothetical protein